VAWTTFRPGVPPDAGGAAGIIVIAILVALGGALLLGLSISRTTLNAMTAFNEDLELAIGGALTAVADPLGTKPTRALADTLNYLLSRARAQPTAGSATPATTHLPDRAPVDADCARLLVGPTFRIQEASAHCLALLGLHPGSAVGRHLVDAASDQGVLDVLLATLRELPVSGERRVTAPSPSGTPLEIVVERAGLGEPISVVARARQ